MVGVLHQGDLQPPSLNKALDLGLQAKIKCTHEHTARLDCSHHNIQYSQTTCGRPQSHTMLSYCLYMLLQEPTFPRIVRYACNSWMLMQCAISAMQTGLWPAWRGWAAVQAVCSQKSVPQREERRTHGCPCLEIVLSLQLDYVFRVHLRHVKEDILSRSFLTWVSQHSRATSFFGRFISIRVPILLCVVNMSARCPESGAAKLKAWRKSTTQMLLYNSYSHTWSPELSQAAQFRNTQTSCPRWR